MPRRWCRRSISRRHRYASGDVAGALGDHHEPRQLAVGLDRPEPRDDGTAAVVAGEHGVDERGVHRRDEASLAAMRPQPQHVAGVRRGDLDEVHVLGRWRGRVAQARAGVGRQRVAHVVAPRRRRRARPTRTCPRRRTPSAFQQAGRWDVVRVQRRFDAVHAQSSNEPIDDGGDGLRCQSPSLVGRRQRVADRGHETVGVEPDAHVADEPAVDGGGDLDPLAGRRCRRAGHGRR
jgi:hypothetical protein